MSGLESHGREHNAGILWWQVLMLLKVTCLLTSQGILG